MKRQQALYSTFFRPAPHAGASLDCVWQSASADCKTELREALGFACDEELVYCVYWVMRILAIPHTP
jgi:hypothetical protein